MSFDAHSVKLYIQSLDYRESSKYTLSNLLCKYLVFAGYMTPEEKRDIVSEYDPTPDLHDVCNVKEVVSKVEVVSENIERDKAIVLETALNLRRTPDIINLTLGDYRPQYSLDRTTYIQTVEHYIKTRKKHSMRVYINKDGSVITKRQVLYLYEKISLEIGTHVNPQILRKQSIQDLAKLKGITFVSNLLNHKDFRSTLYIIGDKPC